MIATLLLLCPAPTAPAALPQDPPRPEAPEKAAKRAFPKLKKADQKKVAGWLLELRKGKKKETVLAAREALLAQGAGVVPACLAYWPKLDEERLPHLLAVLDGVLAEAELDLAWKEVGKKTPAAARVYLVRRIADSERKDAAALLRERLAEAETDSREAYEAARGLAWRRDESGVDAILAATSVDWADHRDRLRQDFAGLERGPLSVAASQRFRLAEGRPARLAALRLFELVGGPTQLAAMKPALRDPDNMIKLAAVNACRAIHGEEPVDKASVMQIIELSRSWESKL